MFGLVSRLFERVLVGVCLSSLGLLFFSIAALLRLLPGFLRLASRGLRVGLVLSFRFYRLLLARVAPTIERRLKINVLIDPSRVVASALLSIVMGSLLMFVIGLPVTVWSVGLCLLHGLAVGLAWDEVEAPEGLRLGARIQ
jgi:hypothetical protein